MRRLRIVMLAAAGLALGHTVQYQFVVSSAPDIPLHGPLESVLQASLILGAAAAIGQIAEMAERRSASLKTLPAILTLQLGGFVSLESVERAAFGIGLSDLPSALALGILIQAVFALAIWAFVKGTAEIMRRLRHPAASSDTDTPHETSQQAIRPALFQRTPSAPRAPPFFQVV